MSQLPKSLAVHLTEDLNLKLPTVAGRDPQFINVGNRTVPLCGLTAQSVIGLQAYTVEGKCLIVVFF